MYDRATTRKNVVCGCVHQGIRRKANGEKVEKKVIILPTTLNGFWRHRVEALSGAAKEHTGQPSLWCTCLMAQE